MISFLEPPKFTDAHRRALNAQTVGEDEPGPIVRDFELLLRAIADNNWPVSGVLRLPPLAALPQLNAQMAQPLDVKLKRPQWKSFPHLFGLYLLLRASSLATFEKVGQKRFLRLDPLALQTWHGLNATEKYFTLMETWLRRADDEVIGERSGMITPLQECVAFWQGQTQPDRFNRPTYSDPMEEFRYWPGLHHLALFEEFGLIEIDHIAAKEGEGWKLSGVKFTRFGDALMSLLAVNAPEIAIYHRQPKTDEAWQEFIEAQENALPWGEWQSFIAPYFKDWRRNFTLPGIEGNEGVCVFKVSLDKVWRRIAIPSQLSLDDLSDAIINAFDFDFDHLYAFSYRSRTGAKMTAVHPFMEDEPPLATEVKVGEVPLRIGDEMEYLYDFGDRWQFAVELEEVRAPDPKIKKARVIEAKGESPQQYWSDDDEDF